MQTRLDWIKNCKEVGRKMKKHKMENKEEVEAEITEKKANAAEAVTARKKKFKDDMAERDAFYRPSEMAKIYPNIKKRPKRPGVTLARWRQARRRTRWQASLGSPPPSPR